MVGGGGGGGGRKDIIPANCPGTSRTVPNMVHLSEVPEGLELGLTLANLEMGNPKPKLFSFFFFNSFRMNSFDSGKFYIWGGVLFIMECLQI